MEVSEASDKQLWQVCRKLPSDFEPFGERKWAGRSQDKPDCDTCRWFQPLLRPGRQREVLCRLWYRVTPFPEGLNRYFLVWTEELE